MAVALILAAGRGERLGAQRPKALVELAGRPLLHWSIQALRGVAAIERIVVALPPGVDGQQLALSLEDASVGVGAAAGVGGAVDGGAGMIAVEGGAVRSESVRLALAGAGSGDPVLVHDAARPLLTAGLIEDTLAAVAGEGVDAAIAAAAVTDTIKLADSKRVVSETLERSRLWAVQTPQVFRRAALERALDVPHDVLVQATDDAWLIERMGGTVVIVPASPQNLKVTTPRDLKLAELLLASPPA